MRREPEYPGTPDTAAVMVNRPRLATRLLDEPRVPKKLWSVRPTPIYLRCGCQPLTLPKAHGFDFSHPRVVLHLMPLHRGLDGPKGNTTHAGDQKGGAVLRLKCRSESSKADRGSPAFDGQQVPIEISDHVEQRIVFSEQRVAAAVGRRRGGRRNCSSRNL